MKILVVQQPRHACASTGDNISGTELAKLNKGLSKVKIIISSLERTEDGFKVHTNIGSGLITRFVGHMTNLDGSDIKVDKVNGKYRFTSNQADYKDGKLLLYIGLHKWTDEEGRKQDLWYEIIKPQSK